ncbi:MAG: ParB/RepB/Spo0J family partition protein [Caulobacterales bacterium]
MVESRRGLGRGLSALLDEADGEVGEVARGAGAEIPIELIRRNPDQPRRQFDEAELDELSASIRERGVLQPVLLRPAAGAPGEYQIVAGERRWRAAQRAGSRTIPAVVRDLTDEQVLEIGIVENVQRTDLTPLEEADGYRALMDRFGRTQEAVAKTVGKSRSHVANTLRLLQLPPAVQAYMREGRLTAGHARAVASAENPELLARQIVERGLNVRDAEALARGGAKPRATRKAASPAKDTDTLALESDLGAVLGLGVQIIDRDGAGEVRIRYASLEQLDDLCRRLTRGG